MKPIELLLLQGTKLSVIQLFGVRNENSGLCSINAKFEGKAYVQNLTTKEKSYLTSGEDVAWEVPYAQATDYFIVGQIKELNLNINGSGPRENYIQKILFATSKCEKFVYNAFSSNPNPNIPTITGNKYVKEMELTIFGAGAYASSVYDVGTFFQTLNRYNGSSLGTLKMENGFVNIDTINAASAKNYLLSPLE